MPSDQVIVALDVDTREEALGLVDCLRSEISFFKVGSQLFTRCGPSFLEELRGRGVDLFLDLKFHDIPQTVHKAVRVASAFGVRLMTLHASGGREMMRAAVEAAEGKTRLLAVTVLTSFDEDALREIGVDHTVSGQVLNLARLAASSGIDGLVCSPHEIELIRSQIQVPLMLVTPGIRGVEEATQDQKRTLSAAEAIRRGANHLVIGRPITQAKDPVAAARAILASLS